MSKHFVISIIALLVFMVAGLSFASYYASHSLLTRLDEAENSQTDQSRKSQQPEYRAAQPPEGKSPGAADEPSAWISTKAGSEWLRLSTACLADIGCRDGTGPVCSDDLPGPRSPKIKLQAGERIVVHSSIPVDAQPATGLIRIQDAEIPLEKMRQIDDKTIEFSAPASTVEGGLTISLYPENGDLHYVACVS